MNDFPVCPRCPHSWHGLPCTYINCECKTSATNLFEPDE